MSSLYHEYLVDDREFTSYEDFKNNCKLKTKPDLVIVMYNADAVGGEVDYTSHTDIYDFK